MNGFPPPDAPCAPDDGNLCHLGGLCFSRDRPLDGALGSELITRGLSPAPLGPSSDERAAAVAALHRSYRDAGAQWLTAHTFLAHTLPDPAASVAAAVRIAREAAGDSLPVALSLGPGASMQTLAACVGAGADAGAALVVLETFTRVDEAAKAVGVARSTLPVAALLACDSGARTLGDAVYAADAARRLVTSGAAAVGANCRDPESLRPAVAAMARTAPGVPIVARPSAGIPRRRGERWRYPWTPARWASASARLRAAGADLVGGCCGAGPEFIAALAERLGPL